MSTTGTENMNGGSTLDADIDSVFGPMENNGVAAGHDSEDDDDTTDGGNANTQTAGGEQTEEGDGSKSGEDDPLAEFAPTLKAPPLKDAKGNIVDKDGNIIAATRAEKREMYAFNKLRAAADAISRDRDMLRQEVQQLSRLRDMPGRLGLNIDQVTEAMEFRARIERDPVTAVRDIVAKVMGNGYTMEQLFGADAAGYINQQMLNQALEVKLGPLNQRMQQEDREARIAETAQREMNNFLAEHEYADVHGEAIVALVNQHDITPQKAYYELRQWAAQNGFDFTQDLRQQVVQRLEQRNQQQNGQQQQQRRQAPSTPGGTRNPASIPQQSVAENTYASPESSFRDIVASAMRDYAAGGGRVQ